MKRLTMLWYDGNQAICENEECSLRDCPFADPICEQVQSIIDRLAAYEDTGLEPEEIDKFKKDIKKIKDDVDSLFEKQAFLNFLESKGIDTSIGVNWMCDVFDMLHDEKNNEIIGIDRLRELVQADKNKCVIITPYPISEGVIEHDPVQLYRIINNKARPFEVDSLIAVAGRKWRNKMEEYIKKSDVQTIIDNEDNWIDMTLAISDLPAEDVAPVRHGRWVRDDSGVIYCSECGEEHDWDEYRATYCDACGAKMDGGSKDEQL